MSAPRQGGAKRRSPLNAPPLTLTQLLSGALITGCKGAIASSVVVTLMVATAGVVRGHSPNFLHLSTLAGWTALIALVLFFLGGILGRSRALQDASFRITGFLATFFGLAVLVFFLSGLTMNVCRWFYYTPLLVEMKNQQTLKARRKAQGNRNDPREGRGGA